MISAKVVSITQPLLEGIPDAEGILAYCARVSNPSNQMNFETADKLLGYCARKAHWSVFEMADLTIEIKAPRDISRQILRHQSAKFQEFSQRYAKVNDFVIREARLQDETNRQNSITLEDEVLQEEWKERQQEVLTLVQKHYEWALEKGIAKECARVILPEGNTMSCLYMKASVRTWIHYLKLRTGNGTQLEHQEVADLCREQFIKYFPSLAKFLEE